MADLGFDYNAGDHKPLDSREPIPVEWYTAQIIESEVKPTQKAGGEILNLTWVIVEGPYEGRRVWDRVNLKNANPQAVEIGMRQLSSICGALGLIRVQDSAELHDIQCKIRTKIVPAGPDRTGVYREAKNEVSDYKSLKDFAARSDTASRRTAPAARPAAPAGATAAASAAPAAPAAPTRKPWERSK